MSHVLAAVDFSGVCARVVAQAERLARALDAPLTLLHVAAPNPAFVGYEAGPSSVRDSRAHELRDEHRELNLLAERLRAGGLEAKALLVEGPSAETILREAERLGADLIVIGSHGHGALHDTLVGSVSAAVVRKARCPVLVVPAR